MAIQDKLERVARISKVYGAKGEVVLRLYDPFPEEIDLEEPLFITIDKLMVPLYINSFSFRGEDKAVAIFEDLDSELRVSEFIGYDLYLSSGDFDDASDDEIAFEELVGYHLFDLESHRKGLITNYLDYDKNPIFVVDFDGVEVMVPCNDDSIGDIYVEAKVVEAVVPEGLYEFYQNLS